MFEIVKIIGFMVEVTERTLVLTKKKSTSEGVAENVTVGLSNPAKIEVVLSSLSLSSSSTASQTASGKVAN